MVAVISLDAYPFFGFLRTDMSPWGDGNRCFLVALCRLIVRTPNLEVATKRLLHQQVKIPGLFGCHVCAWKSVPIAISGGVDIFEVPGCHLLGQMSSQWGSQKLPQELVSHELTAYLSIFNPFKLNELWPYYQKHKNQILANWTTLWSLALRIFEAFIRILLIVNLSLNQTLLTFLLCVRQTWMTQLILAISLWEVIFL